MNFGERLTQLRKEYGYSTRNEFADKLGIPSTTLRNYETNAREPGHTFLKQISEFFNVSVDYLLCLTDDKEVLNSFRLHAAEQSLIEKYRSLDSFGQETVSITLDRECKRVELLKKQQDRIAYLEENPIVVEKEKDTIVRLYTYMHKIASAGNGFYFDDIPTDTIEAPYLPDADFIIGVNGDSMEPTYSDGDLVYVEKRQIIEVGEIGVFILNNECYIKEAGENGLISHNKKYDMIPGTEKIQCIGKVLGKVEIN